MDQMEEKENRFQEPTTDRCKEDKEQNNSEESSVYQRKQEEEKGDEKESSEEATPEAMVVSLFVHPCSLLQYIARVCACCLGLSDFFCDPKPSPASVPEPAAAGQSQQGEEEGKMSSYFYMQKVTTGLGPARIARPKTPGNPREGSGGNGGHHH